MAPNGFAYLNTLRKASAGAMALDNEIKRRAKIHVELPSVQGLRRAMMTLQVDDFLLALSGEVIEKYPNDKLFPELFGGPLFGREFLQ